VTSHFDPDYVVVYSKSVKKGIRANLFQSWQVLNLLESSEVLKDDLANLLVGS
jgi:predicted transcriptional regulator